MGLDMYFVKKRFIWSNERKKLKIMGVKGIDPKKVNEISEEVMYWRKANAIHRWFVENVQEGKDDHGEHYVNREKVQELLELLKKIMKCKGDKRIKTAKELLPTQSGFFFGSLEYDDWYFNRIKETIKVFEKELKIWDNSFYYYYEASW